MRSRVLKAMDYRSVDLSGMLRPFQPDAEALEREVRRLTNPHVRWEKGSAAGPGDLVVCRLESAYPRFNKENVRFAAGSGMFHKELEELSIGMAAGETREIELPEGRVALTVREVTRRVAPEPDDTMVRELGLEGVSTLEEYRAYLLEQQKAKYLEEALYEPLQFLRKQLLQGTEFVVDKADWAASVQRRLERCRALFAQENIDMEKAAAKDFEGRIPVKSYYELVAMLQSEEWDSLLDHLLGRYYAQEDGFTVTEADYEAYIEDYVRFWHTTPEKARAVDPYESFVFVSYGNHAYNVWRNYIQTLF